MDQRGTTDFGKVCSKKTDDEILLETERILADTSYLFGPGELDALKQLETHFLGLGFREKLAKVASFRFLNSREPTPSELWNLLTTP